MSDIHTAVARALAEMPAIGKESRAPGSMGGYAFRSIEDITAALKPLLAKHGAIVVPSVLERVESTRPIGNNRQMFVIDLHVQFSFYAEDGSSFVASMWGQGTDMGDKATQKAVTSAFKSMLTVTFCIAESDSESFEVPHTEIPRGAATPQSAEPASPAGSADSHASRRAALKSAAIALEAAGKPVKDAIRLWQLPKIDECDEKQLALYDELFHDLDKDLFNIEATV